MTAVLELRSDRLRLFDAVVRWLERHFDQAKLSPQVVMEMSSLEVAARRLVALPLVGAERRMLGLVLPRSPTRAAAAFASLCRELLRR